MGFWLGGITEKNVKLRDFDDSIPIAKKDVKVPLVISNHVGFCDIFCCGISNMSTSFLAKSSTIDIPFVIIHKFDIFIMYFFRLDQLL